MSVKLTTAYWKIKKLNKRFRIIRGSMSASKTYSILTILFEIAITQPKQIITIVTSTYPLLRDGVISDMKNIFDYAGISFANMFHKSDKDLVFPNGSIIQFRNLDALDTHRGKGSRRDYLFCNESNRLSYLTLDPMIVRTDKAVFFDYNPDISHFIEELYLKPNRDDVDFITLTYKDNELIPPGELKTIQLRIESAKRPGAPERIKQWVRVFAYGQLGTYSDSQIYSYEWCDKIPPTAKRIESGMDFGLFPDKTVLVDIWIEDNKLYPKVVFSENNLIPVKLAGAERMSVVDKMDEVGHLKGWPIIADNSGANSIFDMRQHGYNVVSVKKPTGSVMRGIGKIRGYDIMLTQDQIELKEAIESFFFKVDRNGNVVPEPDGHEIDELAALRYGMTRVR